MVSTAGRQLERSFTAGDLGSLRAQVAEFGAAAGLSEAQVDDLVLLAHELGTNAVRHGGGAGVLRAWCDEARLYCQVSDDGAGVDEQADLGRERVEPRATSGRGLWLVRQISERVDIRSGTGGTAVTAVLALPAAIHQDQLQA